MGAVRFVSRSSEPFCDRTQAGRLLAEELVGYAGTQAVVLGVPRGGVIVAREVAVALDAALDVVLARKLGAPGNPELAIGAVAEDGRLYLHEESAAMVGARDAYVAQELDRQRAEISRRASLYRSVRPRVPLEGRTVIVTDDGVATGATMQAALWTARREGARLVVAALPVGPEQTLRELAREADELVCLRVPPFFAAVGQFYLRFDQTQDEELLEVLQEEAGRPGT
jgi:predicted phosphoribosyltransferase